MIEFIRLGADGVELTDNAPESDHVATLFPTLGLIFSARPIATGRTHAEAVEDCKACDLMGFNDWRLPEVEELFPTADRSRLGPAADPRAYPDCPSDWFWTATDSAWSASSAWVVLFSGGDAYDYDRSSRACVRAVRVAAPSASGQ